MNGKRWVIGVVVIVAVGAWFMMRKPSSEEPPSSPTPPPPDTTKPNVTANLRAVGPFAAFQPKRVSMPFTFEYPRDWVAGEEIGRAAPYQQVVILGPRNGKDTYNAGLTIRWLPNKAAGGEYATFDELLQWRRRQHAQSRAFQLLRDEPRRLLELDGVELYFQSEADLAKGGAYGTIPTTIKTREVAVASGDQFFEFIYSADAQDYDRYHHAFDHLLQTLRLR